MIELYRPDAACVSILRDGITASERVGSRRTDDAPEHGPASLSAGARLFWRAYCAGCGVLITIMVVLAILEAAK